MLQASIEFKKIYEHDMDLLIMEEFISDRKFAKIFLDEVKLPDDHAVCKAVNSLADADGESDITLILQYPHRKVALLIEDKIDAPTMPEQSDRYHVRGKSGVDRGEYDSYFVILTAPADYHREHLHDANAAYKFRVYYEDLLRHFEQQMSERARFKAAMISTAISAKKAGYLVQENQAVTEFWSKLRQFCKKHYPSLNLIGSDSPKGSSAGWPEFRTSLGTIKVVYKFQKGFVDLEFPRYGDRTGDLISLFKPGMTDAMQVLKTGKSASIRIADDRWSLDFSQDFDSCKPIINEVLQAVSLLCSLASTRNYSDLY